MRPLPSKTETVLVGLDGANPLAFLASLGALRTATAAFEDQTIRMSWAACGGWRPILHLAPDVEQDGLLGRLHAELLGAPDSAQFTELGDDLTVTPDLFRKVAEKASRVARPENRIVADFLAAFGCDMTTSEIGGKNTIQDTALRTMAGAGHQHFLGFMRNIIRSTRVEHLKAALFEPWRYDDPVQNLTLRWDPIDDVRYALRWRNPSGDPVRRTSGSVLGANRMAIEGLPLFTTAPRGTRLITTGFQGQKSSNTYWTWPIWDVPVTLDVVRSMIAMDELQDDHPNRRYLQACGIREVFRSQRLTIGKVRNFTPGQSV